MKYRDFRWSKYPDGNVARPYTPAYIHLLFSFFKPPLLILCIFIISHQSPKPGGKGDLSAMGVTCQDENTLFTTKDIES